MSERGDSRQPLHVPQCSRTYLTIPESLALGQRLAWKLYDGQSPETLLALVGCQRHWFLTSRDHLLGSLFSRFFGFLVTDETGCMLHNEQ